MSNESKLTKEFADGWAHFCKCIDFGRSALDAEAIRFMNEMPSRIGRAIVQRDDLLQVCETIQTLRDACQSGKMRPQDIDKDQLDKLLNDAIAKAKPKTREEPKNV